MANFIWKNGKAVKQEGKKEKKVTPLVNSVKDTLDKLTLEELTKIATDNNIEVKEEMTKEKIAELIRKNG